MKFPRTSGILLHPTSFPGPYGVGDLGEVAFRFVDFLAETGQTLWQLMPLGYTGYGDGVGTDLTAFISNEMRADWTANREELLAFWQSGAPDNFPDSLPWLYVHGSAGSLPWAAEHLD